MGWTSRLLGGHLGYGVDIRLWGGHLGYGVNI
jgi:hypothetical protein